MSYGYWRVVMSDKKILSLVADNLVILCNQLSHLETQDNVVLITTLKEEIDDLILFVDEQGNEKKAVHALKQDEYDLSEFNTQSQTMH